MTVTTDSTADTYELSLIVVFESLSGGGVLRRNMSGSLMIP
jgi:hypothetical protein